MKRILALAALAAATVGAHAASQEQVDAVDALYGGVGDSKGVCIANAALARHIAEQYKAGLTDDEVERANNKTDAEKFMAGAFYQNKTLKRMSPATIEKLYKRSFTACQQ
ncbi:hypothetical protein [Paraburkholderia nemoris]|uniref:hypothetical protein n=1 Tax=Paraburkholderia nemoris TaxID=2793076 RepID=UPI001B29CBA2|nr:hypothetical protein [Paraburkholderia nemoris]CAE6725144.1 hypothetical protein LMG22931_01923 [Paraburkholderia nemoris]